MVGQEKEDEMPSIKVRGQPNLEDIKTRKGFSIVEDQEYGLVVKSPSGVKYQITPKEK